MGGSFRVHRKVISLDSGDALLCCWTDCEKDGYDLYKAQVNYAAPGYPPNVVKYVFCSETHKMYWVRSGQRNGRGDQRYNDGQLASGDRRTYGLYSVYRVVPGSGQGIHQGAIPWPGHPVITEGFGRGIRQDRRPYLGVSSNPWYCVALADLSRSRFQ